MIQDKIEQAKITGNEAVVGSSEVQVYGFKESELLSLLREVAAEQRKLCQKELDSGNPKVRNAPYPEPICED